MFFPHKWNKHFSIVRYSRGQNFMQAAEWWGILPKASAVFPVGKLLCWHHRAID